MTQEVIFQQQQSLGILELNRPEKLNSLNLEMIRSLSKILDHLQQDPNTFALYLKGRGERSFCAGGDIVSLYQAMKNESVNDVSFFDEEYSLDFKIHSFDKPIVAYAHGLTMGGGMGLVNGARHRIVDETTIMAMPEISIGLFPDIGATYFLNRLAKPWGYLMGLTGMRLPGYIAKELGLADWLISSKLRKEFEADLSREAHDVAACCQKYQRELDAAESDNFHALQEEVLKIDISSIEAFHERALSPANHPLLAEAFGFYLKGSPTSAAVIFKQLKTGEKLDLKEAFEKEKRMAKCFLKQLDFKEGIRALLIDKDKKPKWRPSSLSLVSDDVVNSHFS